MRRHHEADPAPQHPATRRGTRTSLGVSTDMFVYEMSTTGDRDLCRAQSRRRRAPRGRPARRAIHRADLRPVDDDADLAAAAHRVRAVPERGRLDLLTVDVEPLDAAARHLPVVAGACGRSRSTRSTAPCTSRRSTARSRDPAGASFPGSPRSADLPSSTTRRTRSSDGRSADRRRFDRRIARELPPDLALHLRGRRGQDLHAAGHRLKRRQQRVPLLRGDQPHGLERDRRCRPRRARSRVSARRRSR